jgi:hypothetical protein
MTWKSKIMPDDAPELAGSLVGSMLQGQQQEITGDGSGEALPEIESLQLWKTAEPLALQVARVIRAERAFHDDPAEWLMESRAAITAVANFLREALQEPGQRRRRDWDGVADFLVSRLGDQKDMPAKSDLQDFQIEAAMEDQPLWLVMAAALAEAEGSHARLAQQFGRGTPRDMAAVMDAVRIAMLPDEEPPDSYKDTPELRWKSALWCAYNQRQALRDFLRCEADGARRRTLLGRPR